MATNQQQLLSELTEQVEKHIQRAVETFQNLDEKTLLKPAANGGWSIAECIWHLNSYGDFYLPEIKKALAKKNLRSTKGIFKGSWFGSYFTKSMDPQTGKRKMKAFKNHVPPPNLDAHAVVAEFIQQQECMLKLLSQARNIDLDSIKVAISLTKWMKLKLGDVFQFCIAHDERHVVQACRNLQPSVCN